MARTENVDQYLRELRHWREETNHLCDAVRASGLDETLRWGSPCYRCNDTNVVGIVAFKSYFGLWFYQGSLLKDSAGVLINAQTGKTKELRQWRMQSMSDIDTALIGAYVAEAANVAAGDGVAAPKRRRLVIPDELARALADDEKLSAAFYALTAGKRREYAEFIASAKRADTRERRTARCLPMILEGVGLNDRYRR